ncbi:hypothetical protein LGH70_15485 [Hymenobacter sp. BT635]|uniref:SH3 domain-containing protein n=1 Tax=Hymenobacter nitidus TaxID=2880929 RepID=A0ABS8AF08_9BACT|nr:hypothetical protein [Hymenobacter nitidus]MCB2379003.1 hypothetical protein [Hymenobacter nitidus]
MPTTPMLTNPPDSLPFRLGRAVMAWTGGQKTTPSRQALPHVLLLALGITALVSCSDDEARRQSSELRVESPGSAPRRPSVMEAENAAAAAAIPAGSGRRYRVRAETAYFYDSPEKAKPGGSYLRRGDVLYGQDEGNGFVKTNFVNPQGSTVTGWLKAQDLSGLTESAPEQPARSRPVAPAPAEYDPEVPAPAATAPVSAGAGQAAVVRAARSYFYASPDLAQPRKAHCVRGDKVRLGQEQGEAVYVTFTNWEKVTTRGWMKKDALDLGE